MGVRSSQPRGPGFHKTDGHLIKYFRDFSFGAGGGSAQPISPAGVSATGGSQVGSGGAGTGLEPGDGYAYHFFTASSTPGFNVTAVTGPGVIEYVLVAGGGGGGGYAEPPSGYWDGGAGTNTVLTSPSAPETKTAFGGGADGPQKNGGSGSGDNGSTPGIGLNPATPAPVIAAFPGYVPGTTQGFPGGGDSARAGGGGGAGEPGLGAGPGDKLTMGKGGDGISIDNNFLFTIPTDYGTPHPSQPGRWFGGGGGGAGGTPYSEGAGGVGGGGHGIVNPRSGVPVGDQQLSPGVSTDTRAAQNTGGGGGSHGTAPPVSTGRGGGGAGGIINGNLTVSATAYPITIGSGGSASPGPTPYGNGGSGIAIIRYLA